MWVDYTLGMWSWRCAVCGRRYRERGGGRKVRTKVRGHLVAHGFDDIYRHGEWRFSSRDRLHCMKWLVGGAVIVVGLVVAWWRDQTWRDRQNERFDDGGRVV